METKSHRPFSSLYATGLGILLILFAGRVVAQFVQWIGPVTFLPPFGAWQSGALPYPILLPIQIALAVFMAVVQVRFISGRIRPRPAAGVALLSLGSLYLALAFARLGAALSFGAGQAFLGALLPSIFHVVLAAWFLILGWFHHRESLSAGDGVGKEGHSLIPWLIYPFVIVGGIWLHYYLFSFGLGLLWSTYVPIAAGTILVTLLECKMPHREDWKPDGREVKNDVAFLSLIQILLPRGLAFLLALTLLRFLQSRGLHLDGFWPNQLPALVQAALMILAADFLRYWLHRASHEWSMGLWSLHAVHHSPKKLYWVNVGRFHPLEKALQFLCDAAPFILLGVTEEVLSLYFIFYALNGFIQHCNIRLHLGWLNYVISGPELHRWHHSWKIRESNRNYGNNLIVWDLLFRSYFLPDHKEVGMLGLKNRNYPDTFLGQMKAPFHKGLDKNE
jgi:sterol desaturase/sphingolipid hydroxylase (fatty acid hydroxylase superfamily)